MTQANRIRQFTRDHYVAPARAEGRAEIIIRAGDVHQAMGLTNAMPAVCSAIGSSKFDEFAGVTRSALTGPANGANVYFTFSLQARPMSERAMVRRREPVFEPAQSQPRINLDLVDAVVLVSCVKSKLSHSAPARALYTSAWFRKVRDIVEASIGQALQARGDVAHCVSWGVKGDTAKASVALNISRETLAAAEAPVEQVVTNWLTNMPFLWLVIDDEPGPDSVRGVLERNAIALLSNHERPLVDPSSPGWLGHSSDRPLVCGSGLWNQRHVGEEHDPRFLDVFEKLIERIGQDSDPDAR